MWPPTPPTPISPTSYTRPRFTAYLTLYNNNNNIRFVQNQTRMCDFVARTRYMTRGLCVVSEPAVDRDQPFMRHISMVDWPDNCIYIKHLCAICSTRRWLYEFGVGYDDGKESDVVLLSSGWILFLNENAVSRIIFYRIIMRCLIAFRHPDIYIYIYIVR